MCLANVFSFIIISGPSVGFTTSGFLFPLSFCSGFSSILQKPYVLLPSSKTQKDLLSDPAHLHGGSFLRKQALRYLVFAFRYWTGSASSFVGAAFVTGAIAGFLPCSIDLPAASKAASFSSIAVCSALIRSLVIIEFSNS